MGRANRFFALLVPCVIVGAIAYLFLSRGLLTPVSVATVTCPGAPTGTIGVPAIHPRNDCTPSFTEQDVRDYFRSHPDLGRIGRIDGLTITRILFTTSHDGRRLIGGDSVGLPDDAIVCYVEMHGIMVARPQTALPGSSTHQPSSVEATVWVVFDAHTGNELDVGLS